MTLVDLARAATVYQAMGPAIEVSGGSAANTAVGRGRPGGPGRDMSGRWPSDELGDVFLHDITAAGVTLGRSLARRRSSGAADDDATGRCLVLVTEDGERTMATHLGVASTLGPEDLDESLVARAQVVYLEGYLWDLGPAKAAMRRAMRGGARRGLAGGAHACPTRFACSATSANSSNCCTAKSTCCSPTRTRPCCCSAHRASTTPWRRSRRPGLLAALDAGRGRLGGRGRPGPLSRPRRRRWSASPTPPAPGDLYAAGFLYGLTHGKDPETCARLGGLCAAEVISHIGARPQADLRRLAPSAGLL